MLIRFVTAAVVVVACLQQTAAEEKSLTCLNGQGKSIEASCGPVLILDGNKREFDKTNILERLDRIDTCACALVGRELAWASLVNHETDALYQATRRFIDEIDEYLYAIEQNPDDEESKKRVEVLKKEFPNKIQLKSEISKETLIEQMGEDGERQYYWDRLTQILANESDNTNAEKVYAYIQQTFARTLYDPQNMSFELAKLVQENSLFLAPAIREKFSGTCWRLIGDFMPVITYFQSLMNVSDNPKYFFNLATYDRNLYKLRMATLVCKFLRNRDKLVSNAEIRRKYRLDEADPKRKKAPARRSRKVVSESESETDSEEEEEDDSDSDDDWVSGTRVESMSDLKKLHTKG